MAAELDPDDLEIERAVARVLGPLPRARSAFRESVRARFGPATSADDGGAFASRRPQESRKSAGSMLEEALQYLPVEEARPEFRASLKQRFVSGDAVSPEFGSPEPASRTLSSGPFSWQVTVGLLAAAAAVVLIVFAPREPDPWLRVLATGPEVMVDDTQVAAGDLRALTRLLSGATSVATLDAPLELQTVDESRFAMAPFSTLRFTREGATEAGDLSLALDRGGVRMVMSESGRHLVIETPDAVVRVSGTVLSIDIVEGEGTCICVAEGTAEVEVLRGSKQKVLVNPDSTCFVFSRDEDQTHSPEDGEFVHGSSNGMVDSEHLAPLRAFLAKQY